MLDAAYLRSFGHVFLQRAWAGQPCHCACPGSQRFPRRGAC